MDEYNILYAIREILLDKSTPLPMQILVHGGCWMSVAVMLLLGLATIVAAVGLVQAVAGW